VVAALERGQRQILVSVFVGRRSAFADFRPGARAVHIRVYTPVTRAL